MRLGYSVQTWFIYRHPLCSLKEITLRLFNCNHWKSVFLVLYWTLLLDDLNTGSWGKFYMKLNKVILEFKALSGDWKRLSPWDIFSARFLIYGGWMGINGWMQILNVVMEVDWVFYGHSLSWQRTTAYKSNWRENERTKTTLFQKDECRSALHDTVCGILNLKLLFFFRCGKTY